MAESAEYENPLVGSIESQVPLNSPPDDVYVIFRDKCNLFPRLMPEKIQSVELLKPDWNSVGSIRRWTFVDGECGSWKDYVEAIDNEKNSITWTLSEGEVPKNLYCSLKVKYDFYLQCEVPMANVTLTYEKKDANVPVPGDYLDFVCDMVRAADNNPLSNE